MTKSGIVLFGTLVLFITITLIVIVLVLISSKTKKKYQNQINNLELEKNKIISSTLITELNKVNSLLNNEYLKNKYELWKKRLDDIKENMIPKITDKIIDLENLLQIKSFKELSYKIANVELEIYFLNGKTFNLLEEIKNITYSEEKNRNAVTSLKSIYRDALVKYNNNKNDYKNINNTIELGMENIDRLFSAFEISMEESAYDEISKIVKALDDLIKNMVIVVNESPTIIFMGRVIIPKKINEITTLYKKMLKNNYNLDYLNIEYNIEETNKKLEDIFAKLNVLNLEDSIFELKTMLDYYDGLFMDFEKEKQSKKQYETLTEKLGIKISDIFKRIKKIYDDVSELKETYDLSDKNFQSIESLHKELVNIKDNYKLLNDRTQTKILPYSKLSNDLETINGKLTILESTLDDSYKNLGSLKEDELRAREQLNEINFILRETRYKIKEYNLPLIPKNYFVEYSEAEDAVKEIIAELNKKPISIKTLNIRVDTARDLALKVFLTAKELVKSAAMAEMAIVYGNRYRSTYKEIEMGIIKSEKDFLKGNYQHSLETILNTLNIVEPGIHKKLLESYKE